MDIRNILVVDDEEIIGDLLSKILGRLGYDVHVAQSGQSALDIYRREHNDIDLAIIDLSMPGMDGVATMTGLKEIDPHLIILLSSGQDERKSSSNLTGANGFLVKPYRVSQLEEAIKSAVVKRHSSQGSDES